VRAARAYLVRYRLQDVPYRFDILAITAAKGEAPRFELLRDAFKEGGGC
jgi:Holliday junction resolvase-like predicted endonuclease